MIIDENVAMDRLEELVVEMQQRYEVFHGVRVKNLAKYNAIADKKLARRVVLVDEYADMLTDKESKKRLEPAVQRIGQKGRAAGIHLILATQRPDRQVVTGIIKSNLPLKIALQVGSRIDSSIILGQGGAEYLLGRGDMLVGGVGAGLPRLQGPMTSGTEIQMLRDKYAEMGEPPYRDSVLGE